MIKKFSRPFVVYMIIALIAMNFSFIKIEVAMADGPISIGTCEDLQLIKNNLSASYILTDDIDCTFATQDPAGVFYNGGAGFLPIAVGYNEDGSEGHTYEDPAVPFSGVLDGNGHKITGLYINYPGKSFVGLVGKNAGTIKNLGLEDITVSGGAWGVGGIAGKNIGTIEKSYVTGGVTGKNRIGGLVGANQDDVANSLYGNISNSFSNVILTVNGSSAVQIGGLVGYNFNNCIISNSYSVGTFVAGSNVVGGLVGVNENSGGITNSFWDTGTSGVVVSSGGTGKTTSEMKTRSTFTIVNWDFPDTWTINSTDNNGYPALAWQGFEDVIPPLEVYVDMSFDIDGNNCGEHTCGYDAFDDLLDGYNAVASGGTIYVAAAAATNEADGYVSDESLIIDKPVSIIGPVSSETDFYPEDWSELLENFEANFYALLDVRGNGDGCIIINSSEVTISGFLIGCATPDVPAITFGEGAGAPYEDVVISYNYIVESWAGIYLNEYVSTVSINNNVLTGNNIGLFFEPSGELPLDTSGFEVIYNRIFDNEGEGPMGAFVIGSPFGPDLSRNWWGHEDGPSVFPLIDDPLEWEDRFGNLDSNQTIFTTNSNFVFYRPFCIDWDCDEFSQKEIVLSEEVSLAEALFDEYNGTMTIPANEVGNPTAVTRINVNEKTVINIPITEIANTVITLPAGTAISRTGDGETFNAFALTATDMALNALSGFSSGTLVGAFQWGIPEMGLAFDPAITVEMYVGTDLAGETLTLQRSLSTNGGWTQEGLIGVGEGVANGTCLVDAEGICEFQTTLASYYGAILEGDEGIATHTLTYSAGTGGSISGSTNQIVNEGANGTAVTAVANSGYRFVRWSDNSTTNPRTDSNVSGNISVSAIFERVSSGGGSSPIILPPAIGDGARDASSAFNSVVNIGEVTSSGVNTLTYQGHQNNFIAPQSSNDWQLHNHHFVINDLNLNTNVATITFYSEPKTITLTKGETKDVDLDGDIINDIRVTFTDVYVNRAEITIKSLVGTDVKEAPLLETLSLKEVIDRERAMVKKINASLVNRLNGRILLQVEEKGQAWYLEPVTKQKHFMGRATDAFALMRKFGLGITNANLDKFLATKAPSKFSGRIFLAVERNGEAYYVNPVDLKLYYLGRPADAYQMMRDLALGISNDNIRQIEVAEIE